MSLLSVRRLTHAGGRTTLYVAGRPRACVSLRRHTQCERGFRLQTE